MTQYVTKGGDQFVAATPRHLVEQMRDSSFTPTGSVELYMVSAADRATEQEGAKVRSDTPEHFVADLIAAGLIKELE